MQEYWEAFVKLLDTDLIRTDNMALKTIVETTPIAILVGTAVGSGYHFLDKLLSSRHADKIAKLDSERRYKR